MRVGGQTRPLCSYDHCLIEHSKHKMRKPMILEVPKFHLNFSGVFLMSGLYQDFQGSLGDVQILKLCVTVKCNVKMSQ